MVGFLGSPTRDALLTARWNNALSLGLAIPALVYVAVVLSTSVLSDRAGFFGMVAIGAVY